jgi:hypothetical protein
VRGHGVVRTRRSARASKNASASTYEIRGDTLVTHNFVAKAARNMSLTEQATIQQVDADTFVATTPPGAYCFS